MYILHLAEYTHSGISEAAYVKLADSVQPTVFDIGLSMGTFASSSLRRITGLFISRRGLPVVLKYFKAIYDCSAQFERCFNWASDAIFARQPESCIQVLGMNGLFHRIY